jgi:hypothetical protein
MTYFPSWNVVDCNTFIGHWPFRRLRHNDAAGVLDMMDRFGIARACVASADAILYKDCQAGNEQLYDEVMRSAPDRFWLYATLNPAYPGWQRDLDRCVSLGFKALRLYPYYHNYKLDSPEAAAIIDAAIEAGLPISVPCRVVDVRQRHWMDTTVNLDPLELVEAAERRPKGVYILTEGIVSARPDSDLWPRLKALDFNIELSRMSSLLPKDIPAIIQYLGPERVLFGTGFPFKTPSPAFLKVNVLDQSDTVKQQILGGNAGRLFGAVHN